MKYASQGGRAENSTWLGGLVVLLLTLGQLGLWFLPISGLGHFISSGILTVVAVAITAVFLQRKADARYLLVFIPFSLGFGAPGALVIALSYLLFFGYLCFIQPIGELLASLVPRFALERVDAVYERILYKLDDFRSDRVPIPFRDVMEFGSYKQKRRIIEKMLRYFRPAFANALKMGLYDKSSAIKVQAATAISAIDHKMFAAHIVWKKRAQEAPHDREIQKIYGEKTLSYAFSRILDDDRQVRMLDEAKRVFEEYLKEKPDDEEVIIDLAEIYAALNHDAMVKQLAERALALQFSSRAALLLLQALYNERDFTKIRAYVHEWMHHPQVSHQLQEAIALWK